MTKLDRLMTLVKKAGGRCGVGASDAEDGGYYGWGSFPPMHVVEEVVASTSEEALGEALRLCIHGQSVLLTVQAERAAEAAKEARDGMDALEILIREIEVVTR